MAAVARAHYHRLPQLGSAPAPPISLLAISIFASKESLLSTTTRHCSNSALDSARCRARPDVRRPSWDATVTERSKFYPYGELYDEEGDDGGGGMFGFEGSEKRQRNWWSDDDDFGDEDDDEGEDEFWGFKILKAFGWMVPAVLISLILGTGPNALFMAVALPLGQTALSLVLDKVWVMAGQNAEPRPRNRKRSKPYTRKADRNHTKKREQDNIYTSSRETTRSPSTSGNHQSAQPYGQRGSTSFGGWDELDRYVESKSVGEEDKSKRQRKITKVSKRTRNRDSPLFMRVLVAVFPFLGSWARFF